MIHSFECYIPVKNVSSISSPPSSVQRRLPSPQMSLNNKMSLGSKRPRAADYFTDASNVKRNKSDEDAPKISVSVQHLIIGHAIVHAAARASINSMSRVHNARPHRPVPIPIGTTRIRMVGANPFKIGGAVPTIRDHSSVQVALTSRLSRLLRALQMVPQLLKFPLGLRA